jgi:iron-sulfur cluster repair protein YtfE (RIC family)
MLKHLIPLALLILPISPALAQQPTPSQTAIQIDNIINQWAQRLEADQQNLTAAQEKIDNAEADKAKLQARVKELEDKYEAVKEPGK